MCVLSRISASTLLVVFACSVSLNRVSATAQTSPRTPQQIAHESEEWAMIAPHLPDPLTATPQRLELQGDVLRARRFPDDALEYYNYALRRGGDAGPLLNKMGITELELGNGSLSRLYFLRVVKLHKKNAQAWNNLGAVELMEGSYKAAIQDYKKAVKLDKREAVFHSNLGLAYIDVADTASARDQIAQALQLDPELYTHSNAAGTSLHLLTAGDHAKFCVEMAKVYARLGNETEMLHSLETASEAGLDILPEMAKDKDLAPYMRDARVLTIVRVAKSMRSRKLEGTDVARTHVPVTPLPPASR